jgi:hypothetical protein
VNRLEEELTKLESELIQMRKEESRAAQIQSTYHRKMETLNQPSFNDTLLTSLYSKSFETNLNNSLMLLDKRMQTFYSQIIDRMRKSTTRLYTNQTISFRTTLKPVVEEFGDENISIESQEQHIESMINTYVLKFREEQIAIERQAGIHGYDDDTIKKIHHLEDMRYNSYQSVNKYIDKLIIINSQLLQKSLEEFYSKFTKET